MHRLRDRWVWDLWFARAENEFHMFYLQAPRSLGDPDLRHRHASIGHAVSLDLSSWTVLPDALGPGPRHAWDDVATWTGSVIEHGGVWYMLYTGISSQEDGLVQRIGLATSPDLVSWTKHPNNPVLVADPRWYEGLDTTAWREHAWRDPWVFRDPGGQGFHALITARSSAGPADGRGVIGHADSDDLVSWIVRPPLSEPGEFGHLEVPQVELVDGSAVLMFSVGADDVSARRRRRDDIRTAIYICPAPTMLGPFDPLLAQAVAQRSLYSGRLIQGRDGSWVMLGFVDHDGEGGFVGEISDPVPFHSLA
jgi:beta-fructofuranosidase